MKSDLRKKVLSAVQTHFLFSPGSRIVVAVSGGADSVALLDILHFLSPGLSLHLVVAHFNHLLRKDASDGDEEFVRQLAQRYDLPCAVHRSDAAEAARKGKTSIEEAARDDRYRFFRQIAAETGAEAIAVGHHADDQAETFLLRLLRGAGTDGLGAMAWKNAGGVVRPFLGVSRRDIRRYIEESSLCFRDDASNDETHYLRNRIRHELLPLLETYNPSVVQLLASSADILAADSAAIEVLLDPIKKRIISRNGDAVEIDAVQTARERSGVRLRLYRTALTEAAGNLRRITNLHLREVDRLVMNPVTGKSLDLPGGIIVRFSYGVVSMSKAESRATPVVEEVSVTGPGEYAFGNSMLVLSIGDKQPLLNCSPDTAYFDADTVSFPLALRSVRAGDRFIPFGMPALVKLKDFFINSKIAQQERKKVPLLVDSDGIIIWVCGLRRSSFAPLTAQTKRVLTVKVKCQKP